MRSLVRPLLFTLARLGLFLAVATWIAAQWRNYDVYWHTYAVSIHRYGWRLVALPPTSKSNRLSMTTRPAAHENYFMGILNRWHFNVDPEMFYDSDGRLHRDRNRNAARTFPGLTWIDPSVRGTASLALRHWLIVTIFALFYAVLKWKYRKQPEAKPCEA